MYVSKRHTKIFYVFLLILILTTAFYNLYYRLSAFPIYSWDEARHGVSAYEMLKANNFFVNTYRNKIDYWNLKPPLSFWATMLGYKIAGFNTLGLRLFSAVFSSMTILMVTIFVYKKHGMIASLISTLILATSTQFLVNHSSRTGDADALFVFLFTASMLSLFLGVKHKQWFYISGLAFSLAFLTKSWHAGNILIITGLYLIITGRYRLLSYKNWIILCSCIVLPILAWGMARFHYDGSIFFRNMIEYDLLKRSSTTIEGHIGTRFYYIEVVWRFSKFWVMLFLGLLSIYMYKNFSATMIKQKNLYYIVGICLWIFIPLFLYSIVETKIRWYILPLYPAFAIIIGALSESVLQNCKFALKIFLPTFILLCSFHYETVILDIIRHPTPRMQVMLIQKLQHFNTIKGFSLFSYHHSNTVAWEQNMVLAAELYGDLKVKNGDFAAFLKNKKGLLMLKKGDGLEHLIKANQLTIITSNKWGYIVCKKELANRLR